MIASWQESDDKPRLCVENQRHCSADKGPYSQGCGLPSGHYSCESWTTKKAEHQSIDAFGLWCWRRLLKVPWTARRSNQSILRELNPEYSLEGLKLKLQYFGHLTQTDNSVEKSLNAREDWGQKEERLSEDETGWMASPTQWTWVWVNCEDLVMEREAWCAAVHAVAKSWTWQGNWTAKQVNIPLWNSIFSSTKLRQ